MNYTSTMIFTDVDALGEPYGQKLDRVNVQSDVSSVTTHLHVGSNAVITTDVYDVAVRPFVTVDIRGTSGDEGGLSDTALFFHPDTMGPLIALRDACNVALRNLRKMKGA